MSYPWPENNSKLDLSARHLLGVNPKTAKIMKGHYLTKTAQT
jgi:hypothetical protein